MVRMFSGDDPEFFAEMIKKPAFAWTIIVIIIIIVLSSLSNTFGQDLLEEQVGPTEQSDQGNAFVDDTRVEVDDTRSTSSNSVTPSNRDEVLAQAGSPGSTSSDDFSNNFLLTIVHPKVLGMLLLLLVSFFTVLLIARVQDPNNL